MFSSLETLEIDIKSIEMEILELTSLGSLSTEVHPEPPDETEIQKLIQEELTLLREELDVFAKEEYEIIKVEVEADVCTCPAGPPGPAGLAGEPGEAGALG